MTLFKDIVLVIFLNGTLLLSAQPLFFELPSDSETFNRRLSRFANNDLLIGDSSDDGIFSESNGKIFLTRIDLCGDIVWSSSYERSTEYLEFKDVVVNQNDDIFAYGSAYL
ncbi:MAG: hypothetical protein IPL46_23505 [Saprospiraceae bacterium]|nr:hypothetical protein [Saprospiraceae bacterium]